jgi:transposase InsO family protein
VLKEITPRHTLPLQLLSDNVSENVDDMVQETFRELNISHVTTAYYSPNSNGNVERYHRFSSYICDENTERLLDMGCLFKSIQSLSPIWLQNKNVQNVHFSFYFITELTCFQVKIYLKREVNM